MRSQPAELRQAAAILCFHRHTLGTAILPTIQGKRVSAQPRSTANHTRRDERKIQRPTVATT